MDDIVAETGLSKGALYWYYQSKDEIILSIMNSMFDRELAGLEDLPMDERPASRQRSPSRSFAARRDLSWSRREVDGMSVL